MCRPWPGALHPGYRLQDLVGAAEDEGDDGDGDADGDGDVDMAFEDDGGDGAADGGWMPELASHFQEEQRVAHVAVTRAMERLYIIEVRAPLIWFTFGPLLFCLFSIAQQC